jgi:hypothetical protein
MGNNFDYYENKNILRAIGCNINFIRNKHDKEDCQQEIFAELYSEMPMDERGAIRLVNQVAAKFKRDNAKIAYSEAGLAEAYLG